MEGLILQVTEVTLLGVRMSTKDKIYQELTAYFTAFDP